MFKSDMRWWKRKPDTDYMETVEGIWISNDGVDVTMCYRTIDGKRLRIVADKSKAQGIAEWLLREAATDE